MPTKRTWFLVMENEYGRGRPISWHRNIDEAVEASKTGNYIYEIKDFSVFSVKEVTLTTTKKIATLTIA